MKQFIEITTIVLAVIYCIVAFFLTISESPEGEPTIYNFVGLAMIAAAVVAYSLIKDSQTAARKL